MRRKPIFAEFKSIYQRFFKKYELFFVGLYTVLIVCSLTPLVDTYLNIRLIDNVLPQKDVSAVFRLLLLYTLVFLFNIISAFVMQILINKKDNAIVEEMKLCTANGVHIGFIQKGLEERSQMTVVLTTDIMNVVTFMTSSMMALVMNISIIMTFLVYLIRYSLILSLITVISSFLQALVVPFFAKPLKKTSEEFRQNSENELGYISSVTQNMKMLTLFGRTKESIEKYRQIICDFKGISLRNLLAGASQDLVVSLLALMGNILTIGLGAHWIIGEKLTLGVFVAFLNLSELLKGAFTSIISFNASYQSFKVSANRFQDVLRAYPDVARTGEELLSIEDICLSDCEIAVDDVVIVQNLNCCFKKGSKYLVEGPNGCGKSSLLNVICGFLPVKSGTVFVSDCDINNVNLDYLRKRISCCFQEQYFLQDTVAENISSKNVPSYSEDKFLQIADMLEIDKERLNERLDSCASGFSGGELQRIAIARTLMKDADVYLFDESFANIEEKAKTVIFHSICNFLSDKTVVFISHDSEILKEARDSEIKCLLFEDMMH